MLIIFRFNSKTSQLQLNSIFIMHVKQQFSSESNNFKCKKKNPNYYYFFIFFIYVFLTSYTFSLFSPCLSLLLHAVWGLCSYFFFLRMHNDYIIFAGNKKKFVVPIIMCRADIKRIVLKKEPSGTYKCWYLAVNSMSRQRPLSVKVINNSYAWSLQFSQLVYYLLYFFFNYF